MKQFLAFIVVLAIVIELLNFLGSILMAFVSFLSEHIIFVIICILAIIGLYYSYSNTSKKKFEQKSYSNNREKKAETDEVSKFIKKVSKRYIFLNNINQKYFFDFGLRAKNIIYCRADSKKEFDNFDYDSAIIQEFIKNEKYYNGLTERLQTNRSLYEKYQAELSNLPSKISEKDLQSENLDISKLPEYQVVEDCLIKGMIYKPVIHTEYIVEVKYVSSENYKSYVKRGYYSIQEIQEIINKFKQSKEKQIHEKESKEYQRSLMTPTLRYQILKRDGFKCTICGRTVEDGIKLHVDHIKPVSKGGLTTPSNLRTLCNECNSGKSDKYDPNGIN